MIQLKFDFFREALVHFAGVVGTGLPKAKWLSLSKPFFEIWKQTNENTVATTKEEFEFVYRSDIGKDSQNPEFSSFELTLAELCDGETYKTLLLKVFTKGMMSKNSPILIGNQRFSLHGLLCSSLPKRIQDLFEDEIISNWFSLSRLCVLLDLMPSSSFSVSLWIAKRRAQSLFLTM